MRTKACRSHTQHQIMEFEFNSNDSALILASDETGEGASPSFGPGDGDAAFSTSEDGGEEEELYNEDYFEYPAEITDRMVQLSCDMEELRNALAQERRHLFRESEEIAALRKLDARNVEQEYEESASQYEPRDSAFLQAERRRQEQAQVSKGRYMRHMMQVEKMCSEEFSHLNDTRAKVDRLNREISDWRLANGTTTGFAPFPMEVMRSPPLPCQAKGGSATMPGRFTVNMPMTNAGYKSVPNVTIPHTDVNPLTSGSFDSSRPWVQTFPGAMQDALWCEGWRGPGSKEEDARPQSRKSGDAEDRTLPVLHF